MSDNKYDYLKNRSNAKLSKIKIAPINIKSDHKDGRVSISKEAANSVISKKLLKDMPVHYTKVNESLPMNHRDANGNFIHVGHILNEGEIILEDGEEYLEVDAMLYSETQKELVDEIIKNVDLLGNSWEMVPSEGIQNNTHTEVTNIVDVLGSAILDSKNTAFKGTKIVFCSKDEEQLNDYYADDEYTILKNKLNYWGKENYTPLTSDEKKLLDGIYKETKKTMEAELKLMKEFISVLADDNKEMGEKDYEIIGTLIEQFEGIIDTLREKNDPDYYKKLSSQLSDDNGYMKKRIQELSLRVYGMDYI